MSNLANIADPELSGQRDILSYGVQPIFVHFTYFSVIFLFVCLGLSRDLIQFPFSDYSETFRQLNSQIQAGSVM